MGRLVLFVLMWGVVWTEEYGSGGIPQYGGAGDYADSAGGLASVDYIGHSPDAAAPLDYKYVEDSHASPDKISKEAEVADRWPKPKKRRQNRHYKDDVEALEPTHYIKHRSNHRPRHRSRATNDKSRSNQPHRRRRVLPDRPPDDVIDDDTNLYRDEVKKENRDDIENIHKVTTERIIRRKPRDRHIELSGKRSDSDEDEFIELDSKPKDVEKFMPEYPQDNSIMHGRTPPPPIDDDDFDEENIKLKQPKAPRTKDKTYRDYSDYYDMKRVYNIKNRLPMLIRRTPTGTPIPRKSPPTSPSKDLMALLAGVRRAGSDDSNQNTSGRQTTLEERVVFTDISHHVTDVTIREEVITTSTPLTSNIQFVTETYILPTTTFSTEYTDPGALSIAEKSRLSILKKAQRKEKDKDILSSKPPIFLQVTNKLHTVVIVAPRNPWQGAKEVSDDNPKRIEKVKLMMRNKIVSQAKDITDLTSNWDDMVCDYIDTSLISYRGDEKVNLLLLVVCSLTSVCIFLM